MSKPFLGDRRKAFEDIFFAKQDEKVLARLREEREKRAAIEGLARASDIDDPELIERLVELGLDARSWTALSLVPEQAKHLGISYPELVSWMVEHAACDA